jgi:hypothetical protein
MQAAANGGLYFLFALATVASSGHSPPGKLRRDTCEYFLVHYGTPPPHSHPLLAKNKANFKQLWAVSAGLTKPPYRQGTVRSTYITAQ